MGKKKKKKKESPGQLPLFDLNLYNTDITQEASGSVKESEQGVSENIQEETSPKILNQNTENEQGSLPDELYVKKILQNKDNEEINKLILPLTYEEIVQRLGQNRARMAELIVPVTEFEKQIIQVIDDIQYGGYLLFLYGVSGVGKSTFISSLTWRKHIPIKEISPINASNLSNDESGSKLDKLLKCLKQEANNFFKENSKDDDKLCVVIDYLEKLGAENEEKVEAFFRDLNGLLRSQPILIVWPVTQRQDLDNMLGLAKSFSSTMFSRKIQFIDFTGPPTLDYPNIAKKTILYFNYGRNCYDFQLNDTDFEEIKQKYQQKPVEKHIIRDYLKEVIDCWETRTNYITKIIENIPRPTEVWFIFSYREAENVVARFAKQSPDIIEETWNADYKALYSYISNNNQRKARWPQGRLTMALSGILTTKIMYLPTNALVSCFAAYANEAKIPIPRDDLINKYKVPKYWLGKKSARNMLSRTPLYLQLSNRAITAGNRKSGTVSTALDNAEVAFEKINEDISAKNKSYSDQRLNKALYLALSDVFKESSGLSFACEEEHPFIKTKIPDILVDVQNQKYVCLEFSYTQNSRPGFIADYVLKKLDDYMKQLQSKLGFDELQDNLWH